MLSFWHMLRCPVRRYQLFSRWHISPYPVYWCVPLTCLVIFHIVVHSVDGRLVGGAGSEEKTEQKTARMSMHEGVLDGGKDRQRGRSPLSSIPFYRSKSDLAHSPSAACTTVALPLAMMLCQAGNGEGEALCPVIAWHTDGHQPKRAESNPSCSSRRLLQLPPDGAVDMCLACVPRWWQERGRTRCAFMRDARP